MDTFANWPTGLTLTLGVSVPSETPFIVTRAFQTRAGWLGQVLVDGVIAFETTAIDPDDAELPPPQAAIAAANRHVVARLRQLFAD